MYFLRVSCVKRFQKILHEAWWKDSSICNALSDSNAISKRKRIYITYNHKKEKKSLAILIHIFSSLKNEFTHKVRVIEEILFHRVFHTKHYTWNQHLYMYTEVIITQQVSNTFRTHKNVYVVTKVFFTGFYSRQSKDELFQ